MATIYHWFTLLHLFTEYEYNFYFGHPVRFILFTTLHRFNIIFFLIEKQEPCSKLIQVFIIIKFIYLFIHYTTLGSRIPPLIVHPVYTYILSFTTLKLYANAPEKRLSVSRDTCFTWY